MSARQRRRPTTPAISRGPVPHPGAPHRVRRRDRSGSVSGVSGGRRRAADVGLERVPAIGPGTATDAVPATMTMPPTHSHITSGWMMTRRPIVGVGARPGRRSAPGTRRRSGPTRTDGVPIVWPVSRYLFSRGSKTRPPSTRIRATELDPVVPLHGSLPEVLDRVAGDPCRLALGAGENSPWRHERGRRGERHRDHDRAEVDDHAAVGPAHQAPPALAAGREHQLADAPSRRRTRPARTPGAPSATPPRPRRPRTTVATPAHAGHQQTLPQQLAGRLAPGQHRSDGHQREQREADRHRHAAEVRHARPRAARR